MLVHIPSYFVYLAVISRNKEINKKNSSDLPRITQPANVLGAAAEVSVMKTGSHCKIVKIRQPQCGWSCSSHKFFTIDWPSDVYIIIYTYILLKAIILLDWTVCYLKQKRKIFSSDNFWFEHFSLSRRAPTINCYGWKFGWFTELSRS